MNLAPAPHSDGAVRLDPDETWVTVEQPEGPSSPPGEPSTRHRGFIAAVALVILGVLAATWWNARPEPGRTATDEPIVAPTSTAPAGPSPSIEDGPAPAAPSPRIASVLRGESGWVGLTRTSASGGIVRSLDGLEWEAVATDVPGTVLDLGRWDGRLAALVSAETDELLSSGDGEAYSVVVSDDDGATWRHTGPFGIRDPDELEPVAGALGFDAAVAVSRGPTTAPVPAVSELLERFVAADVAARTCAVEQVLDAGRGILFELRDCDGDLLEPVAVEPIDFERLQFAREVLRSQYVVDVRTPRTSERTRLAPGRFVVSVAGADGAVAVLAVDVLFALEEPNRLLAQSIPATLLRWTPGSELEPVENQPSELRAWRGNELVERAGGTIALTGFDTLYSARPPRLDTWVPLTLGPPVETTGSPRVRVSRDGRRIVVSDAAGTGMWISGTGTDWEAVDLGDLDAADVLIGGEGFVIVITGEGRLVRVDLDDAA